MNTLTLTWFFSIFLFFILLYLDYSCDNTEDDNFCDEYKYSFYISSLILFLSTLFIFIKGIKGSSYRF